MRSLSIIIPSYNGRTHLERCLPSVCRHAPAGTQILVVDDASSDGTREWLAASFPQVQAVTLPVNQGFCRSVNEGVHRARGEVVELLNNDTMVQPGWAEPCLRHFDDPTVGSVAPLVLFMDRPTVIESAGQGYHICGWGFNRGYGRTLSGNYLTRCEVFGPSASSGFYRRAALERAGTMLPEFGAYFEDIDLSFRLRWAGYRSIFEPDSRVLHRGSASYGRENARVVRLLARNEELAYWINLPARDLLPGLLPHLAFLTVRTVRKAFGGHFLSYVGGKREVLAQWRTILKRRRQVQSLARRRPNLALARSPRVLADGLTWLKQRQCP
jgi:GT2 family glycosyltransferase